MISRRMMLSAAVAGLGSAAVPARSAGLAAGQGQGRDAAPGPLLVDPGREPDAIIPLWPGGPPGGTPPGLDDDWQQRAKDGPSDRVWRQVATPHLALFRARNADGKTAEGKSTDGKSTDGKSGDGSALMIMPGGGYGYVVIDKEGYESARWFSRAGMTVFVLFYRLPGQNGGIAWAGGADAPLQDAQRAMRLIRHGAGAFGLDPARLAALGFSAGGHVAGSLATRFDARVYEPVDAADSLSARPDLCATIYPVITLTDPHAHGGSRDALLGPGASPEKVSAYSVETRVSSETPPLFIAHATDDPAVPVDNALMLYEAARRAGVSADLHLFAQGGHGFGLRIAPDRPAAAWPTLFERWRARHFFADAP